MDPEAATEAPPNGSKRPRGRPGSGRKAGGRNHVSANAKENVGAVLDKNAGRVFQRLCNIAFGLKIRIGEAAGPNPRYIHPSEASQMKALEILAKKLRPDLAAQALTGADDEPLFPKPEAEDSSPRDVARVIMNILRQ